MKLIAKGENTIDFFVGDYSFISGILHKIEIYFQGNYLCINIIIGLLYAPIDNKVILLRLENRPH